MKRLAAAVALVAAIAVLALLLVQRRELARLEQQLAAFVGAPAASAAAPGASGGAPSAPLTLPQIERRIAALEQTVARVFRLLLARGTAGSGGAAAAGGRGDTSGDVTALRADVDALLAGEALDTEQGRQRLHKIVREQQQQLEEEQHQRRRQVRDQLQQERVAQLVKDAGLNAAQTAQLNALLDGERDQRRALMRGVRSGAQPVGEAMQQLRSLRQITDEQARALLDSRQYEAYEKMRREGRGGRGFWR